MSSMASTEDMLATEAGVQTYLQNTAFASHSVNLLSAGFANYTYRIHLHAPIDGMSTFVLKYAGPVVITLANGTRIVGSPARQVFFHSSQLY